MLVRPITKEEQLTSARLFSIAFESPLDPHNLTPFAENPVIWAAFDDASGDMMSTIYVTDYQVQFDGGTYRLAADGDALLSAVRTVDAVWESRYNMMLQHTEADYRWLLEADPAAKQEFIYAALSEAGEPLGYAAFKKQDEPDGRNLICSRFRFLGRKGFAALMSLFSRLASDHRYVKLLLPADTAIQYLLPEWSLGAVRWELQSAGMVRVVNARAALLAARYRGSGSVVLRLYDAMIPENDGCFAIRFEAGRAVSVEPSCAVPDAALPISTFSALLCGVCGFAGARQFLSGIEIFRETAPLDQIFFRKPLFISDYF